MKLHEKIKVANMLLDEARPEMQELRKKVMFGDVNDPKLKYEDVQQNCDEIDIIILMLNKMEDRTKYIQGVEDVKS